MAKFAGKRIQWLTQLALLTAITVLLQMVSASVKFGVFQITLALVPIIIGAAVLGVWEGGWLGLVFGAVVLLNGDAAPFLAFSVPGTVVTVLGKGVGAGLAAGAVYKLLEKKNQTLAALAAAIAAPIANTGLFILGCYAFFIPLLTEWAGGQPVTGYIFLGLVGMNFVVEFVSVALLSGVIVRVVRIWKKKRAAA
jgi:uncharacterized membrane protein